MLAASKVDGNGEGVYCGNYILGVVALYEGNVNLAKRYLIESGNAQIPVPKGLPYFDLASRLLDRGERDAVGEFLDKVVDKFKGRMERRYIKGWIRTIRAGGNPGLPTMRVLFK